MASYQVAVAEEKIDLLKKKLSFATFPDEVRMDAHIEWM